MKMLNIYLALMLMPWYSCGTHSGGDEAAKVGNGSGEGIAGAQNEAMCPALSTSCPANCDPIQARGVDTRSSATRRCRGASETLGCYHRPESELERDACVVNQNGQAFSTTPSAEAHLTAHGYRSCNQAEQAIWTESVACD